MAQLILNKKELKIDIYPFLSFSKQSKVFCICSCDDNVLPRVLFFEQ
jgi:hypothetical protein